MPFKSEAQHRYFRHILNKGEVSQDTFNEMMNETKKIHGKENPIKALPARIEKKAFWEGFNKQASLKSHAYTLGVGGAAGAIGISRVKKKLKQQQPPLPVKQASLKSHAITAGTALSLGAIGTAHLKNKQAKKKDVDHPDHPDYPRYLKGLRQGLKSSLKIMK